MRNIGLYWFGNDLRVNDNANLLKAASEVDDLLCIYCLDPQWLLPNRYDLATMSANRWRFLKESLLDMDKQLHQYDPEGRFINKWQGRILNLPLDSVDAADWSLVAG